MEERQVHVVEIKAPVEDVWAEITKLKLKTRLMLGMMSAFMFMAPKDTLRKNIPELKEK